MRTKAGRKKMATVLPDDRDALMELRAMAPPHLLGSAGALDAWVARQTGIDEGKVRKVRGRHRRLNGDEYRAALHALFTALEGLSARHEQIRANQRRIAELLEPRRSGASGDKPVGAGRGKNG